MDKEELQRIIWEDHDNWETMEGPIYCCQSRWSISFSKVAREVSSNRYIEICWDEGSTEYQEVDFEPNYYEVVPYEVTVTKYKKKES